MVGAASSRRPRGTRALTRAARRGSRHYPARVPLVCATRDERDPLPAHVQRAREHRADAARSRTARRRRARDRRQLARRHRRDRRPARRRARLRLRVPPAAQGGARPCLHRGLSPRTGRGCRLRARVRL